MKICVIGVGYVGLVTGSVFADLGNDVVCIDNDKAKINMLKKGKMPIYEPGLEELVKRNSDEERLLFSTNLKKGVQDSEIIFIAVGTPPKETGETDLSAVEAVAREIARAMNGYKVIVNKSTVPVGTGDFVRKIIEEEQDSTYDFHVVSNPEFLKEGTAIDDSLNPDRVVIGVPNFKVAEKFLELYAPLDCPKLVTDVHSAEMIKYASNAFLATKISFINAIANICEEAGADVMQVAKGMGLDKRIGLEFLQAGLGYGGSCFPKDTESLVHTARKFGYKFDLLQEVININEDRVPRLLKRIKKLLGNPDKKTIGVLGLAFKPNTDDIREAKALYLIKELMAKGAKIKAFDPIAMPNAKEELPKVKYCNNSYEVAEKADAIILATEWNEFRQLNFDKLRSLMKGSLFIDCRNIYDPEKMRKDHDFDYYGIGR